MLNKYGVQIQETCCSCYYRNMKDGKRVCGIDKQTHESNDTCKRWECRPALKANAGKGDGPELRKRSLEMYYAMCRDKAIAASEKENLINTKK